MTRILGGQERDSGGDGGDGDRERRAKEIEQLKREIRGMKKGARAVSGVPDGEGAAGATGGKDTELLPSVEQRRAAYKSARRARGGREKDTLEKLAKFQASVSRTDPGRDRGKSPEEATRTEVGSYGWQVQCRALLVHRREENGSRRRAGTEGGYGRTASAKGRSMVNELLVVIRASSSQGV